MVFFRNSIPEVLNLSRQNWIRNDNRDWKAHFGVFRPTHSVVTCFIVLLCVLCVLSAAGGWFTDILEPQRREERKGFLFFPWSGRMIMKTAMPRVLEVVCGRRHPAVKCFIVLLGVLCVLSAAGGCFKNLFEPHPVNPVWYISFWSFPFLPLSAPLRETSLGTHPFFPRRSTQSKLNFKIRRLYNRLHSSFLFNQINYPIPRHRI